MKKLLIICALAATVAGCNSNASENAKVNYDSIRIARDQAKLDSFERVELERKQQEIAVAAAAAAVAKERASTSSKRSYSSSGTSRSSANRNQVYTQTSTQTQAPAKKGWSSAAKGAVIGGVVGAGTGVIVDKKDGRGAAIGGVIGAGTGYVIGRQKDKRTGRAQ